MFSDPLASLETRQPIWLAFAEREKIVSGNLSEQAKTAEGLEYTCNLQDIEADLGHAMGVGPDSSDPARHSALPVRALRVVLAGENHEATSSKLRPMLHGIRDSTIQLVTLSVSAGSNPSGSDSYQARHDFTRRVLQAIRFEAESSGAHVAFEVGHSGALTSPLEVRELVDTVNSSAIGVTMNVYGTSDLNTACDWIETLTHRMFAIRLGDTRQQTDSEGQNTSATDERERLRRLTESLSQIDNHCTPVVLCESSLH